MKRLLLLALAAAGCRAPASGAGPAPATAREPDAMRHLAALAHDSMEGRQAGTPGSLRAARYVAERFRALGLEPAGDSGFYQRVPLARGGRGLQYVASWAAFDSLPPERRVVDYNVVGVIPGSDPALRDSSIFVGAHHDHIGIARGAGVVGGDSINNGADDDASGVAAVLEVARALSRGPRPKRTVVLGSLTAEEYGMLGTQWYVEHPARPIERMSAGVFVEMIGRPDSLVGGAGRAYLTGEERSTMGELLRAAGVAVARDPRPAQRLFERSDNIVFARRGVPAHTLSSYNMHGDYHRVTDEVSRVDAAHFASMADAAVRAARALADGAAPRWNAGGRPEASARPAAAPGQSAIARQYRETADRLIEAATRDSAAWQRIARLSDTFGARFSGTPALERAIDWVLAEMKKDGLEHVRGEPVMVPRWVRGAESARLVAPRATPLHMLGLGGSVGTPARGVTAEVLVVASFDDLAANAARARGRIVLFDVPFVSYGQTVAYRVRGAVEAAKVGAVASLVRSVGPFGMQTPHTGSMQYDTTGLVPRIPAAALSMEDAMMLHRMQDRGERVVVHLTMGARTLPDVESRNVVAEIVGRERPDEVVVLGGHIDSWDVGTGAMDDAGGVVAAWEAVRLMKALGLRPRRTVRVVGWTNEENGLRGGNAYRDRHRDALAKHVLAMESDGGVFKPLGFGFTGSDSARAIVRQVASLLDRIGAGRIGATGGGADIGPIMREGVPGMGLEVENSRYFWYHHTAADTPDKLDPRDVALSVAAMAVMAYVIADLPESLPRAAR